MKTIRSLITDTLLPAVIALVLTISYGASSTYGQGGADRDMSGAERNVRELETRKTPRKDAKTILAEVNEDFAHLRADNEKVKNAGLPNAALDYHVISETSADIKKSAARLKTNLAGLPKPENEDKETKPNIPQDEAQMRSLLASLNGLITRFVGNPVFSDMGTLDNQLARQARRDLDSLIDLNEVARKGADKLGKRAQ